MTYSLLRISDYIAVFLFFATPIVEFPKIYDIFRFASEENFNQEYSSANSRFYSLQTPASPRIWILIHLIQASLHVYLSIIQYSIFLESFDHDEKDIHYDVAESNHAFNRIFELSHNLFVIIISFQLYKLSSLPWQLAMIVNFTLVGVLHISHIYHQYWLYLLVLALPVVLGVVPTFLVICRLLRSLF